MNEALLVLERSIEDDLEAIDRIFDSLPSTDLDRATAEEECIVIGYRLHNLYNACENIFRNIARAFENSLDERAGWHAELLRRMRLDLTPIRPAVIDADTFDKLDELRRFRHVFRSLYSADIDPARMAVALDKARQLRSLWPTQLRAFMRFLTAMRSAVPAAEAGESD